MRGIVVAATTRLLTEECCNCHMIFAMPEDFRERARRDPEVWFYCPRGHHQHYVKSEVTRLKEELESKQKALTAAWERESRLSKERDHHWIERKKLATRHRHLKQRVKNGVCPCCHRSFENLRRHMDTQHPDFAAEPSEGGQAA